jgi:hypothetical protein
MKNDLQQAQKRAYQYWHIDGLYELAFGGFCLALGLYFFAQASLPHDSLMYNILDMGLILVLGGTGLVVGRLLDAAKHRITYPRTGYVAYHRKTSKRPVLGVGLAMIIGAVVATLFINTPASLAWMPAFTGIILAAVLVYLGMRVALLRFYGLSFASLVYGVGLSLTGIGDIPGLAAYYALIGLTMGISGGFTLRTYLRRTQPAEEHDEP